LAGLQKRRDESPPSQLGEWTVMGIIKRLDDQRRVIDMVRSEVEHLKSVKVGNVSGGETTQELGQLVRNIETALMANKQLTDSVIKIRKAVSRLMAENERLRRDIEAVKAGPLQVRAQAQKYRLCEPHLRMLRAVSTGAKSSAEISHVIGRSREHTSRMARRMIELGMFEKQMHRYTPKYALTEAGTVVLKNSEDVSLRQDAVP